MTVEHSAISNANLHEPKDISAAGVDTIYAADGSGSGTWRKLTLASSDAASIKNTNILYLTVEIENVATAQSVWVVTPLAGDITSIWSVVDGTVDVTTTLTAEIGGTAVTNSTVTIATSGAAGDVDSATPTAAKTLTAGQAIEIICGGEGSTATKAVITIQMNVA